MSTVPLPSARPVLLREPIAAAPEAEQCGSLARGPASILLPTVGTVSCVRPRDHDGAHEATGGPIFGRRWLAYRW
jgi:hypothetical protein